MSADTELLDELYRFCVSRASERAAEGRERHDSYERRHAQITLQILLEMRLSVLNRPESGAAAIEYLRRYAMRDGNHPDFKPEWNKQDPSR
jgi:hypothetical protein